MSMYQTLKEGGRKSTATLMVMMIITASYLIQYPQVISFMVLEKYNICFDHYWTSQLPAMSTTEYLTAMVSLIGLFGATNAAAYYGGDKSKP